MPVTSPRLVSMTITLAPMTGSPETDRTVPVTLPFGARAGCAGAAAGLRLTTMRLPSMRAVRFCALSARMTTSTTFSSAALTLTRCVRSISELLYANV